MSYQVVRTRRFTRSAKRTHPNVAQATHEAIAVLAEDPKLGDEKKSDLEFFSVYKFQVLDVQYLLAYLVNEEVKEIVLIAVGPHENFYRDLKR
jgi:mRNA interferase RelE/StbE